MLEIDYLQVSGVLRFFVCCMGCRVIGRLAAGSYGIVSFDLQDGGGGQKISISVFEFSMRFVRFLAILKNFAEK